MLLRGPDINQTARTSQKQGEKKKLLGRTIGEKISEERLEKQKYLPNTANRSTAPASGLVFFFFLMSRFPRLVVISKDKGVLLKH